MNRVALALSALLLAACKIPLPTPSVDAGADGAPLAECEGSPCLNGGVCNVVDGTFRCACLPGFEGETCEIDVDDCDPNPCQNDGLCSDRVASYQCACSPGFTGVDCSTDINDCEANPCENGATCIDLVNAYQCDCAAGFSGSRCEVNIDDCASLPCDNDGTCQDEVNGFSCDCPAGTTGQTCSNQVEPCADDTCQNSGTCEDTEDGFKCTCAAGYVGVNCENNFDDCAALPCLSGGSCVDNVNGYTCECPDGYDGPNCENLVDPCNPDPCQNGGTCNSAGDYYVCSCEPGYNGTNCQNNIDDCATNPCGNGGMCEDLVGDFACTCLQGYSGPTCNNEPPTCPTENPCNHGDCKDDVNGYKCDCDAGWIGAACDVNVDDCVGNPCGEHGSCADGDHKYTCTCDVGFEGPECQANVDDCASVPCKNGGVCSDLTNDYECECTAGWGGPTCDINIEDCDPNPCENGGQCTDLIDSYTCDCPPGYEGDRCQTDQCSLIGACGNGVCDGQGGCTCDTGWTGDICQDNIDECTAGTPCLNGGECTDSPGSFSCDCATGYTGMLCADCATGYQDNDGDDICCQTGYKGATCNLCDDFYESVNGLCQMTCTSAPKDCGDHGTCDDTGGEPVCDCEDEYFGELCDSLDGACTPEACGDHGDCQETSPTTHTCTCDPGYYGRSCELVDECALAVVNGMTPCFNGGTCVDGDGAYTCQCVTGWLGADCSEPDDCAAVSQQGQDPCNGHGTCVDGDSTYTCACSSGWLGAACDVQDFCATHNCQNGGLCVNGSTTYTCNCAGTGYEGDFCQSKIDYCTPNPCLNNGTCTDIGTTFSCDCSKTGYSGTTCETDVDECADLQANVCGGGTCVNVGQGNGYTCQCPDGRLDVDGDGTNCSLVESLSAGAVNTCAISTAGSLHCWGDNTHAQLGNDTTGNPAPTVIRTPVRVGTGTGWTKVSVGNGHVCGLRSGHLYCWGNNTSRQLGFSTSSARRTPVEPRPDLTWNEVSAGGTHTCGLSQTALYCWGNTVDGQAGTAATGTYIDAPKVISGTWSAVSAGANHTCAINAAAELRCWGSNSAGQLGGTQPIALPGGADGPWNAVKAGATHTCAVAGTRTYCWGAGVEGALGNGAFASSTTPVQVSTASTLASHSLGTDFSCGVVNAPDASGTFQIYCWGTNLYSQLLTADPNVNVPTLVTTAGSPAWSAYSVGAHHTCAVSNGTVYCWGSNADGAVGNGVPDLTPVNVPTLVKSGVASHTAVNCYPNPCRNGGVCSELANDYSCDCAGTGFSGKNCTTEADECGTAGICGQGTCRDLLDDDGYTCTCPDGTLDVKQTGLECVSAEQIAAGSNHTCAISTAKTLHCWGSNFYGQFGLGTVGSTDYYENENTQTIRTPKVLKAVTGVTGDATGWNKVVVGETHTCATLPLGTGMPEALYCWGNNGFGQVGRPIVAPQYYATPQLLDNTQTWTALAAGYGHTCGIASGALYCWGYNNGGQIGNNTTVTPVPFSLTPMPLPVGQTSWIAVAGGAFHTCAITDTNSMYCWGVRTAGQVGIGATGTPVLVPTKVNLSDPQGFTAIQADFSTSCGLVGNAAYCWGQGNTGGMGNGTTTNPNPSPVAVSGMLSFSSLSLGSNFACGLVAVPASTPQAYNAHCWGSNSKNLHLTGDTTSTGIKTVPTALNTTRQWRVFDVGPTHICGVDNADGLLYCWGDNGVEGGVGKGKLATVPYSLIGNFGIGVVKTWSEKHTTP